MQEVSQFGVVATLLVVAFECLVQVFPCALAAVEGLEFQEEQCVDELVLLRVFEFVEVYRFVVVPDVPVLEGQSDCRVGADDFIGIKRDFFAGKLLPDFGGDLEVGIVPIVAE